MKNKNPRSVEKVLAILYVALTKEHWEKGPNYSEAVGAAHDWFYNTYGYDGLSASVSIPKIVTGELRAKVVK